MEAARRHLAELIAGHQPAADPSLREALGLDEGSRVVVVATEGPTDPEVYEEVVGSPPAPLPAP